MSYLSFTTTTHQHVQSKLKYVKGNTSHVTHTSHSFILTCSRRAMRTARTGGVSHLTRATFVLFRKVAET
jgi:hypothetical protein